MSVGVRSSIRERLVRILNGQGGLGCDGELALCGECGYQLDGLLDPRSEGLCPECGGSFNPFAPHRRWTRKNWLGFCAGACGPTLVMLVVAWASTLLDGERLRLVMGIAGPFWIFMLAYAALVWPALWTDLRRIDRSGPERRRMLVLSYLGAGMPVVLLVLGSLV